MTVVDLGGAPGSWTQAAHREMEEKEKVTKKQGVSAGTGTNIDRRSSGRSASSPGVIIAVDLLPLKKEVLDLPGVQFVQGDFLSPLVRARILKLLPAHSKGKVDLVLSDMLANVSGNALQDAQSSIDLCGATLEFALANLRGLPPPPPLTTTSIGPLSKLDHSPSPSKVPPIAPSLVMKCLQSSLSPEFNKLLKTHFATVRWEKPASSRPESREGYFVCSGLMRRELATPSEGGKGKGEVVEELEEDGIYF